MFRRAAPAIALFMISCGRRAPGPAPAIDSAMAAYVPTDASTLAGLNLDALRRSPLLPSIPPDERAFLETFRDARSLLVAGKGSELLMIAQGALTGWTAAAGGVSLNGSPELVRAATAQHARPALLEVAEPLAGRSPMWAVVRGGTVLPLQGNLANLNNLLRGPDYVTLAAQLDDRIVLQLTAPCPTDAAARRFEGSLRAVLALSGVGMRQADAAGLLRSVQVRREDRTVRASLSASPDALGRLLH